MRPSANSTPMAMRDRVERSRPVRGWARGRLTDPLATSRTGGSELERSVAIPVSLARGASGRIAFFDFGGLCTAFASRAAAWRSARFFAVRSALRAFRFARCSALRFRFFLFRTPTSCFATTPGTAADFGGAAAGNGLRGVDAGSGLMGVDAVGGLRGVGAGSGLRGVGAGNGLRGVDAGSGLMGID